jgi:hypothetical protein
VAKNAVWNPPPWGVRATSGWEKVSGLNRTPKAAPPEAYESLGSRETVPEVRH